MCGICGVIRFDPTPVDPRSLSAACNSLIHRGPDGQGIWLHPDSASNVGLAATRLAILDPTHAADQPFHRAGRFHLVYNGELYNYRELRAELAASGDAFLTDGDTEVVLAACARWGTGAFSRFNGMWALAFYDSLERKGFLCRDRFGIKPLLYALDPHALRFASEMRALTMLDDWPRAISHDAILDLLTFGFITHPATIYQSARKLPPGHLLRFDAAGALDPEPYYRLEPTQLVSIEDYAHCRSILRRRLQNAVTARKVSHVPIGAFLSGGIDSSIVALHLLEAMGTGVSTFSIGFKDAPSFDESSFAVFAARHIGANHHQIMLGTDDIVDAVPRVLSHLSEPFGDSSILPTALLSHFTRQYVTVALSGDGGDELFGGYWRYLGHESLHAFQRLPRPIQHLLQTLVGSLSSHCAAHDRFRQFQKLLEALPHHDPLARHLTWARILRPQAESIFRSTDAFHRRLKALLARAHAMSPPATDSPLKRIFFHDLYTSLPDDMLAKVDLASMTHSLEVRVPFLDSAVVELAFAMPDSFKIDRGLRKRILIDAYRSLLPDEILDRPKKGFEVPFGDLLRGPLQPLLRDTVTPQTLNSLDILDPISVDEVIAQHIAGRCDHANLLFALLSLCWWKSRN